MYNTVFLLGNVYIYHKISLLWTMDLDLAKLSISGFAVTLMLRVFLPLDLLLENRVNLLPWNLLPWNLLPWNLLPSLQLINLMTFGVVD